MTAKGKSLLKYLFAFTLLALIIRHAGTDKILAYLKEIPPVYLVIAFLLSMLAQLLAALRMQYFFRASGFPLTTKYAVVLYYVGAFYNFLLPGGIGGDAYKVILARRHMEMPATQGIKIMIADRAGGLCIVMLIMFLMLYFVDLSHLIPYYRALLALGIVVTLVGYIGFSKLLLKKSPQIMLGALPYSFVSQSCWVMTLIVIWKSIGGGQHLIEYIVFYSAASIAALIPVSVGGLGIKEMTYYYGADLMQHFAGVFVNPDVGIALSLCIFAMTFITSLPGLIFLEKIEKIKHYH